MDNNTGMLILAARKKKFDGGVGGITKAIISKVMLLFSFQQTSLNKSFFDFRFLYNARQLIIPGVTSKL